MKKLLLILVFPFLVGCETDGERIQRQIYDCEANGLYSKYVDYNRGYIKCSSIKPHSFEWCVDQCEELFYEQAKTWGNGSETQSQSSNECLNICLSQDNQL